MKVELQADSTFQDLSDILSNTSEGQSIGDGPVHISTIDMSDAANSYFVNKAATILLTGLGYVATVTASGQTLPGYETYPLDDDNHQVWSADAQEEVTNNVPLKSGSTTIRNGTLSPTVAGDNKGYIRLYRCPSLDTENVKVYKIWISGSDVPVFEIRKDLANEETAIIFRSAYGNFEPWYDQGSYILDEIVISFGTTDFSNKYGDCLMFYIPSSGCGLLLKNYANGQSKIQEYLFGTASYYNEFSEPLEYETFGDMVLRAKTVISDEVTPQLRSIEALQKEIADVSGSVEDLGDTVDALEEEIEDIPDQIEEAVNEAVQSLTGSLSANFVAR